MNHTVHADDSIRPWGRYEILQESETFKVKSIRVNPHARLSYQKHKFRAEHWFITQGTGEVTVNGVIHPVSAGSFIEFAAGDLHRMSNTGDQELVFIEVQTGTYFGEDDIERVEDDFGR